jgi:vancomycin resistance protein YoaR
MPNFSPEVKGNLYGFAVGVLVFLLLGSGAFLWIFYNRIYPGIFIDSISVGGLTKEEAVAVLNQRLSPIDNQTLTLAVDDITISSSSAELGVRYGLDEVVNTAYQQGKEGSVWNKIAATAGMFFKPQELTVPVVYDAAAMETLVSELNSRVETPSKEPQALLGYSNSPASLSIDPGLVGRTINSEELYSKLTASLQEKNYSIAAPVASVGAELSEEEAIAAKERAKKMVDKRIILRAQNVRVEVRDQELVTFLKFPQGTNHGRIVTSVDTWKDSVTRPTQDAVFEYDPETLHVKTFKPHQDGLALDVEKTVAEIEDALILLDQTESTAQSFDEYHDTELELPVIATKPAVTLNDTNDLGIKEIIGFGESEYDHSIPNRIHNVAITAERVNDIIIPPGTEFSFNKTLGDVSAATGYRSAYVIKNGKTELGDGGGVCQVSTTVFRAVLNAGLEVTRRLPHSYRVSYYELNAKPGIDATVYAGEVDFRFKNDTDHHILLHTTADSENLYMKVELYGTSDGRTTEITNHEVWDYRPAPPAEFYPDASIPSGQRKQIDWAVAGVRAKFTNTVKDKDGNLIRENTYTSNYKPWSAKYLVGI